MLFEVSSKTIFKYYQKDQIIWATYEGGSILLGNIVGKVDEDGKIEMRFGFQSCFQYPFKHLIHLITIPPMIHIGLSQSQGAI